MQKILVIKLSAIGDFIQATGALKDIRRAHPEAHITLLTTKAIKSLAETNPHVDEVVYHVRPKPFALQEWLGLRYFLRDFDMTYDLQCNDRTNFYYKIAHRFGRAGKWCGIAKGCTFWQDPKIRAGRHSQDFLPEQLRIAGLHPKYTPDVSYAAVDVSVKLQAAGLTPKKFVVLIPGSSAGWVGKRWPHYVTLAKLLKEEGWQVALCGGPDEGQLLNDIARESGAINLQGFSLPEFMGVFKASAFVVGNDTGPMHMAAACGHGESAVRGIVLFGPASDFERHAPKSPAIEVMNHVEDIGLITPDVVLKALTQLV